MCIRQIDDNWLPVVASNIDSLNHALVVTTAVCCLVAFSQTTFFTIARIMQGMDFALLASGKQDIT